jgi:hypothetical protein
VTAIHRRAYGKPIGLIEPEQIPEHGHQNNWRQEDINLTERKCNERINDDIATEMAPTYPFAPHHFRNALKKSSEWKSLADFTPVLMTLPLAGIDNERMFSQNPDIIGTIPPTELLLGRESISTRIRSDTTQ